MKIAMLGAKAVPTIGGIAGYIEEVGARLVARGHEVTVYCRPHFLGEERGEYRGMQRVVTGGLRGKHLDAGTHVLTSALHALRSDYDIIHIHGAAPGLAAPLLQLRPQARIVTTLHGLDWTGSKWGPTAAGLMYRAARVGAHFADRLTAVSRWVRDECRRRLACDARYIPTGVNFPSLASPQEISQLPVRSGQYLLCASRLVPEKGLHYLLEAYRQTSTDLPLVIAGNCPYRDPYVQRLQSLADERVIFAGYVKGRLLQELFSNAYLYVQPSESEGLPLSVLEALSYGRCVLASDIPQNAEALGPCGFTFASRSADSLASRLQFLLAHPDVVGNEFSRSRDYILRERNWDVTTDGFEEVFNTLLLGGRPLRMICAAPA